MDHRLRLARHHRRLWVLSAAIEAAMACSERSQPTSERGELELHANGHNVSRKRVARLMGESGLKALPRRRFRRTTDSSHRHPVAPNLLKQNFAAAAPNQAWVGDITYVWTLEGWAYLAVLIDLCSRRVVGCPRHFRCLCELPSTGRPGVAWTGLRRFQIDKIILNDNNNS